MANSSQQMRQSTTGVPCSNTRSQLWLRMKELNSAWFKWSKNVKSRKCLKLNSWERKLRLVMPKKLNLSTRKTWDVNRKQMNDTYNTLKKWSSRIYIVNRQQNMQQILESRLVRRELDKRSLHSRNWGRSRPNTKQKWSNDKKKLTESILRS